MKYIPLGTKGTPILSYKENPHIITEETGWIDEAVAGGYGAGVFLDSSGLVVVDCDSSLVHGPKMSEHFGWESFQDLCVSKGLEGIPYTFTVATRTPGHYHLYFRQNPEYRLIRTSIHTQLKDVDIKVTGYVKHWKCKGYSVARNAVAITLPKEIAKALYRPPYVPGETEVYADGDREMTSEFVEYSIDRVARAVNGSRNSNLYRTASVFRSAGLTDALTKSRLLSAAVKSGLSMHEASRTLESSWYAR